MGRYLEQLKEQFDEISEGIEEILDRAADEGREVTKEEQTVIDRDSDRAEELKKSIEHYGSIEVTRSKVAEVASRVPAGGKRQSTTVVVEREKEPNAELLEAFPTPGDYIVAIGRALRGDKAAAELIERATQHQTTADNPGLLPRPILQPVISLIDGQRPFISSITRKALPTGAFDRPIITQHVAVGKQPGEKQLTDSQKMIVGKLPVAADTFAGHLNVSRQDIKWSQPGIMNLIAEDFATIYAIVTNTEAAGDFVTSLEDNTPVPVELSGIAVIQALYEAAAAGLSPDNSLLPTTLWVAADVWGALGGLYNAVGAPVFPSLQPTSTAGNPLGLKLVVDPNFPAGWGALGQPRYAEWYEDLDGFMQVAEPDVLGQLVGYAGYGAFLNTAPEKFTVLNFTEPAAAPAAAAKSSSSK